MTVSTAELDVLIRLQTSGQANIAALDAQLAGMGGNSGSVANFTNALQGSNAELVTAEQFTTNYGAALTSQEAAYARTQLAAISATESTGALRTEFNTAARAASALGVQSGEAAGRLSALGTISGGALSGGLLIGLAAMAAFYEVGKSAVDNSQTLERTTNDLASAFATQGRAVPTAQIQAFIDKNKQFISNQYDVEAAFAKVTRAGYDFITAQRIVNDALDLAAAKDIPLATATTDIIDAENGRVLGLIDLGISIKNVIDPQKDLTNATKEAAKASAAKSAADRALQEDLDKLHTKTKITQADEDHLADLKAKDLAATKALKDANANLSLAQQEVVDKGNKQIQTLDQIEAKTQGARADITSLQKDQNSLNKDWQDFSARIGPAVVGAIDDVVRAADIAVQILGELGTIISDLIHHPEDVAKVLQVMGLQSDNQSIAGRSRRQFGGQVYSGQSYLVGESGPELLTLGPGGGQVTPNNQLGAGADLSILEQNTGTMVDLLAMLLDNMSGGLGYSTLASLEYSRSRGIAT